MIGFAAYHAARRSVSEFDASIVDSVAIVLKARTVALIVS
jgi:hypothetical protein